MNRVREFDPLHGELYLAGELVPPGSYREISYGRIVRLARPDVLPASLDGHIACYGRLDTPDQAVVVTHSASTR